MAGAAQSSFSLQKISANLRSCALAAWDSSCSRWLFCRRLATSDCSTALSCFSCGGPGVSGARACGPAQPCLGAGLEGAKPGLPAHSRVTLGKWLRPSRPSCPSSKGVAA